MQPDTAGKRLALLRDAIPGLSRVGLLCAVVGSQPGANQWLDDTLRDTQSVARALDITIRIAWADQAGGVDAAFAALNRERVAAMLIPGTGFASAQRDHLADLARKHRIPIAGDDRSYAEAGFLMSYGPFFGDLLRRAAIYIDKILKGAKPGDLPIEQPTVFGFEPNLPEQTNTSGRTLTIA